MENENVKRLPLGWTESFDEDCNSFWVASSRVGDDGASFVYRIKQRLAGNRIVLFVTDSDEELIEDSVEFGCLGAAKRACEEVEFEMMEENLDMVQDEKGNVEFSWRTPEPKKGGE